MKANQVIFDESGVRPICRNPDGFPLVASLFGGGYGVTADYLTQDGKIHCPARNGGTYREARYTDRIFDNTGKLYPIPTGARETQ
jgi:hypothetical protein